MDQAGQAAQPKNERPSATIMLIVGMILIGAISFAAMLGFVRLCEKV